MWRLGLCVDSASHFICRFIVALHLWIQLRTWLGNSATHLIGGFSVALYWGIQRHTFLRDSASHFIVGFSAAHYWSVQQRTLFVDSTSHFIRETVCSVAVYYAIQRRALLGGFSAALYLVIQRRTFFLVSASHFICGFIVAPYWEIKRRISLMDSASHFIWGFSVAFFEGESASHFIGGSTPHDRSRRITYHPRRNKRPGRGSTSKSLMTYTSLIQVWLLIIYKLPSDSLSRPPIEVGYIAWFHMVLNCLGRWSGAWFIRRF